MPKTKKLTIKKHLKLTPTIFELTLTGDDFSEVKYGQFINLKLTTKYLRRPISICDFNESELIITYKILGEGTKLLSELKVGNEIDCMYPLGNGFDLEDDLTNPVIIGGGIGVPPLVGLYNYLRKIGKQPQVFLGFRNADEVIYREKFQAEDLNIYLNNNEIYQEVQKREYSTYFACGPTLFLDSLVKNLNHGQLLVEERMGCGIGICMGCSRKVGENKYKRVCVEGPMFFSEELAYELENKNL